MMHVSMMNSVLLSLHIAPGENMFDGRPLWKPDYTTAYFNILAKVALCLDSSHF